MSEQRTPVVDEELIPWRTPGAKDSEKTVDSVVADDATGASDSAKSVETAEKTAAESASVAENSETGISEHTGTPESTGTSETPTSPAPELRASAGIVRVLSQGVYETKAMLRNGEQLMLNIAFPVMALFGLRFTTFLDDYAAQLGTTRIQLAVPGVLTLCVISTALSGQGIATGFDRRYGVLRFLSTTPLGRNGLILGKLIAVAAVICIQFALVCAVSFGLGWQAEPFQLQRALTSMWVGGAAFTALGLLIAGTVRAEATLAIVNITWAILAAIGGVLVPVWAYAQPWQTIVTALPSGALGEALRADFYEASFSPWQHVLLIVWALVIGFAASRLFKWSD